MVEIPLDRLLTDRVLADLHIETKPNSQRDRARKSIHREDAGSKCSRELATIHPCPGQAPPRLPRTRLRVAHRLTSGSTITSSPSPARYEPTLEETPPFMRATTLCFHGPARPLRNAFHQGLLQRDACQRKTGPQRASRNTWRAFNVGTIISTSVHEAYPGHYVQFLWQNQFPSKVRKLVGASTNIEGWAHYCEQMMLDEGYGQPGAGATDEREARLIRLGQLQDALLRDARFITRSSCTQRRARPVANGPSTRRSISL